MSMTTKLSSPDGLSLLSEEFSDLDLGDARRVKRLGILLDSATRLPGESLPLQARNASALEGTYRFLNNAHIKPEAVLEAHIERTAERAAQLDEVVVAHDTTQFEFDGEMQREGLGHLRGTGQGFFAHYSFAIGLDGRPLGVAALRAWTRGEKRKGKKNPSEAQLDPDRESMRWLDAADEVHERMAGRASVVHTMDREGDTYELFAHLLEHGQRFVIRLSKDRNLVKPAGGAGQPKLYAAMADGAFSLEREVHLSRRTASKKGLRTAKIHPSRKARVAHLCVRTSTLTLARGIHMDRYLPDQLTLNFVDVYEPDPPEGEAPVSWRLATTEPLDTPEQVARVVDIYRLRWTIEEYFKAIKTGCAYEKRQLESAHALAMALAIFSAVAWRLLLLRWLERQPTESSASLVLTPTQLKVLQAVRRKEGKPLTPTPTCSEVLLAIAALGGHLRNNGPPGWIVLGRGFDKLLWLEEGWVTAREAAQDEARREM